MLLIAVILFWLGLCAGSFVNALVWRLHEWQEPSKSKKKTNLSLLKGRSVCPDCRHTLAWHDLIPVVSWMALRGKCHYCGKAISAQYPVVELIGGSVFALSYIFWPETIHLGGQWLLITTWLICSVG